LLTFKLETSQPKGGGRVKRQPEWAELFAVMLKRKRANVQFQYKVFLPFSMEGMNTRESIDLIVQAWLALEPLLEAIRGANSR
jgi:hypothetical protein